MTFKKTSQLLRELSREELEYFFFDVMSDCYGTCEMPKRKGDRVPFEQFVKDAIEVTKNDFKYKKDLDVDRYPE